jgi:hypothetical protein
MMAPSVKEPHPLVRLRSSAVEAIAVAERSASRRAALVCPGCTKRPERRARALATVLARMEGVQDDSGLIDLLAIHNQAKAEAAQAAVARMSDPPSMPPGAFTIDTAAADDAELEAVLAANARKRKAIIGAGAAAAALVIGLVALVSSGGSEPPKAAAAARAKVEAAPPPPAAAAPSASVTVEAPAAAAQTPPPPTTGTREAAKPPKAKGAPAKAAPRKSAGPKLQKVQSSGV